MSRRIKVTGYLVVDDEEIDEGPKGPLTEEAFLAYSSDLGLEDMTLEFAEED